MAHLVLLGGVHFAEGDVAAGGNEDRIVAEALVAARRPDRACRRRGPRTSRPDRRSARRSRGHRRNAPQAQRRARSLRTRARPFPLRAPVAIASASSAQRAEKMPGAPCNASTHRPLSSARREGRTDRPPGAPSNRHCRRRCCRSLPAPGGPALRRRRRRCRAAPSARAISRSLPAIMGGDDQLVADRPHRPVALSCAAKISAQPIRARRSSRSRPSSSKRLALGRHLRLDDRAVGGQDEIAVRSRP